ncbi:MULTISPECIES: hypothetical protein [Acinetobacter]|jgi:hypothetical protein|uniref:hypothetical protein n=1 Tax=Acinetobacter TaxID=469 RepID=UPI0002AEDC0B|nr:MULTISPECIES: hypothetical protein [Acinetobacter]ELW88660.1 hypothetical protein ACINWC743_A0189 [Acinetobacter sp. WC-743]MBJ8428715.1 hypothetical protein [Acinetobacter bereziniae]MBJ8474934.1 hypothetical protein [Acinetobacter bereziniae]MBJ8552384.1 hypothetical protein [Acinetobacter bereziniae]MCU4316182.1 hypothetical protein [Acinetobacter bereziniae]
MKKILLSIFFIFFPHLVCAEEITEDNFIEVICGESANYALQVMQKRQTGVTITEALNEVNQIGMPGPRRTFFKSIVYDAYKVPRVIDEKQRATVESEFSNKIFMICSESMIKEIS